MAGRAGQTMRRMRCVIGHECRRQQPGRNFPIHRTAHAAEPEGGLDLKDLPFDLRSAQGNEERDLLHERSAPVVRPRANVALCSAGGRDSESRPTVSHRTCERSSTKDRLAAKSVSRWAEQE